MQRKYAEIHCVLTYEHKNTVKETLTTFQTNAQLISLGHVRTKQSSTRYALQGGGVGGCMPHQSS